VDIGDGSAVHVTPHATVTADTNCLGIRTRRRPARPCPRRLRSPLAALLLSLSAVALAPRSRRGARLAAGHWWITRTRCFFWTGTCLRGRGQMSQSRNIREFGYDRHLRHSTAQRTSAEPSAGGTSNPSGQLTRSPRSVRCVRSRSESSQIRGRIRPMPGHAYASHRHRHRRDGPGQGDQREHPYRARAAIAHKGRTRHCRSPPPVRDVNSMPRPNPLTPVRTAVTAPPWLLTSWLLTSVWAVLRTRPLRSGANSAPPLSVGGSAVDSSSPGDGDLYGYSFA